MSFIKQHWLALIAIFLAIWALWLITRLTINPVEEIEKALSPAEGEVAVSICRKPETTVVFVKTPQGQHYEAKYEVLGTIRYDLTWQVEGTSIAIEELKGREFDFWAEQMTPEFQACLATKIVQVREAAH